MDEEINAKMSDAPGKKVSVVIPTKNGGAQFEAVLKVVAEQQTDWPFEIIVIDSGSVDGTLEFARGFPGVRLLSIPPEDFQHGRTRNEAIGHAAGEFIAMLTQDALPADGNWLRTLVAAIEEDPQIAGVFGRHIAYGDASIFTREELVKHFAGFLVPAVVHLSDHERYKTDVAYRQFLYFYSDNNSLLRRSVWQLHPYPEVEFAEDQAWAKVIIEAGFKKAYSDAAAVYHSHNYGIWERFQRSFDESMAIDELFDYKQAFGILSVLRSWVGLTLRDIDVIRSQPGLSRIERLQLFIRMPVDNLMRIMGSWLGTHRGFGNDTLIAFCSRDKKLKRVVS
jgi:rhamnosyltransferase